MREVGGVADAMKQAEMIAGTDFGAPNFVSLTRARALVADVCDLANVMDETFHTRCRAVERAAKRQGAHSVARAVCWLRQIETLSRHGYDAMHIHAERVAHRWLARQERT
jgi:hypothetical protein